MLKLWQKHQKFLKGNKGFSLVELIIVIAIMAALVAILAPQYLKYVEKSRATADATNLDELVKAVKVAAADPNDTLAAGTYSLTVTTGSIDLTPLGTNVTNNLGETAIVLKSAGAKTAAGTKVTITIDATTYAVTCTLKYDATAKTWSNS